MTGAVLFLCGCLEWVLLLVLGRSFWRWGWGRVERETGLRRAPALGSRESGNDGGGGGGRRGLVVSEGGSRSCGTGGSRTAPTVLGARRFGWRRGRFPPSRERRWGAGGRRRERETAPPGAPALGSRFRGNDERGRPFDRLRANGVARGAGGVTWGGCGCGTYVLFWMLFSLGLASGGVGFGSLDRGFAPGTHARCVGLWV